MDHISKSLKAVVENGEIGKLLSGYRSVEIWPEVVGDSVSARTTPLRFRQGVLTVEVADPTWLHEISFLRRTIIEKLNRELGQGIVQSIHLVLAGGPFTSDRGH
jgi:hypothetical protein